MVGLDLSIKCFSSQPVGSKDCFPSIFTFTLPSSAPGALRSAGLNDSPSPISKDSLNDQRQHEHNISPESFAGTVCESDQTQHEHGPFPKLFGERQEKSEIPFISSVGLSLSSTSPCCSQTYTALSQKLTCNEVSSKNKPVPELLNASIVVSARTISCTNQSTKSNYLYQPLTQDDESPEEMCSDYLKPKQVQNLQNQCAETETDSTESHISSSKPLSSVKAIVDFEPKAPLTGPHYLSQPQSNEGTFKAQSQLIKLSDVPSQISSDSLFEEDYIEDADSLDIKKQQEDNVSEIKYSSSDKVEGNKELYNNMDNSYQHDKNLIQFVQDEGKKPSCVGHGHSKCDNLNEDQGQQILPVEVENDEIFNESLCPSNEVSNCTYKQDENAECSNQLLPSTRSSYQDVDSEVMSYTDNCIISKQEMSSKMEQLLTYTDDKSLNFNIIAESVINSTDVIDKELETSDSNSLCYPDHYLLDAIPGPRDTEILQEIIQDDNGKDCIHTKANESDEDIPCTQKFDDRYSYICSLQGNNDKSSVSSTPPVKAGEKELIFSPLYSQLHHGKEEDITLSIKGNSSPLCTKLISFSPLVSPVSKHNVSKVLSQCDNPFEDQLQFSLLQNSKVKEVLSKSEIMLENPFSEFVRHRNLSPDKSEIDSETNEDNENFKDIAPLPFQDGQRSPTLAVFSPLSSGKIKKESEMFERSSLDKDIDKAMMPVLKKDSNKYTTTDHFASDSERLDEKNFDSISNDSKDVKTRENLTYQNCVENEWLEKNVSTPHFNKRNEQEYEKGKEYMKEYIRHEDHQDFPIERHHNDHMLKEGNDCYNKLQNVVINDAEERNSESCSVRLESEQVVPEGSYFKGDEASSGASFYDLIDVHEERKLLGQTSHLPSFQWKNMYKSVAFENGPGTHCTVTDHLKSITPLPTPNKRARRLRVGLSKKQKVRPLHET